MAAGRYLFRGQSTTTQLTIRLVAAVRTPLIEATGQGHVTDAADGSEAAYNVLLGGLFGADRQLRLCVCFRCRGQVESECPFQG